MCFSNDSSESIVTRTPNNLTKGKSKLISI
jgi:hypothetical protein